MLLSFLHVLVWWLIPIVDLLYFFYLLSSPSPTHLEVFLKVAARATISIDHFLYLPARMSRYLWFPSVSSSISR